MVWHLRRPARSQPRSGLTVRALGRGCVSEVVLTKPRSLAWFEAVLRNKVEDMPAILQDSQWIDERANPFLKVRPHPPTLLLIKEAGRAAKPCADRLLPAWAWVRLWPWGAWVCVQLLCMSCYDKQCKRKTPFFALAPDSSRPTALHLAVLLGQELMIL